MLHVVRHFPDDEHAQPGLDVGEDSVEDEVDIATSPEEVPLGVEENVPSEEQLGDEGPRHTHKDKVDDPPESHEPIPERI